MGVQNDHSTTETYHGYVETTDDALRIFEACRRGILRRRSRRLCESERKEITSGSLFVWEERESGIRRWTDSKRWSPSRVNGCFLVYNELHPKPTARNTSADMPLDDGLVKKALSLFTNSSSKLHLVCYYRKSDVDQGRLDSPATDPMLRDIVIPRSLYPDVIPDAVEAAGVGEEEASSTPSAGMLTPGGCGIGRGGGRRLSVAACPLLGTQNQDRRLSSCLQAHDCRLVASTQPCLIHSDPAAEPPSSIVAGRAAAPMPSAGQTAAFQKWQQQQQQAIKPLPASSHAATALAYAAESIGRPSDRSNNSSNNDSNSSESTLFSAESAMGQKPAGRISPPSANKALHRKLRLPAISLRDRSHSQQLRAEELPMPAGPTTPGAAAAYHTSADAAGQIGGAPAWFKPMGCATAPSSRRSTLVDGSYFPAPPNDNRSSRSSSNGSSPHPYPCALVDSRCGGEEDPIAAAIRLPPMSELLRSINSNGSTGRSSPADTEARRQPAAAAAAVENTRAKYARVPWNSNNKHHRSGAARGSDTLLPSLHLSESSPHFPRRDYAKAACAVSPDISSRNPPMAMPMGAAAAAAPPSMFAASVPLHSYSIR
ncbi:Gluconate transport-inducing protein [Coemansia sp. RSA 2049]|nr:Gluconate transport-inducing protein [Coemansia sp. RSA 1939]KAJ2523892.1 Gluconate transport-inducing protein [Coemansia sp. RSA 2049]KAJ2602186.1 Gluconate transport-inducing protein [Coemansia sp. RSA 1804]KAJ2690000.1 Gluconate transport-inducing protein [Coemansia sp. RSA 1285]